MTAAISRPAILWLPGYVRCDVAIWRHQRMVGGGAPWRGRQDRHRQPAFVERPRKGGFIDERPRLVLIRRRWFHHREKLVVHEFLFPREGQWRLTTSLKRKDLSQTAADPCSTGGSFRSVCHDQMHPNPFASCAVASRSGRNDNAMSSRQVQRAGSPEQKSFDAVHFPATDPCGDPDPG